MRDPWSDLTCDPYAYICNRCTADALPPHTLTHLQHTCPGGRMISFGFTASWHATCHMPHATCHMPHGMPHAGQHCSAMPSIISQYHVYCHRQYSSTLSVGRHAHKYSSCVPHVCPPFKQARPPLASVMLRPWPGQRTSPLIPHTHVGGTSPLRDLWPPRCQTVGLHLSFNRWPLKARCSLSMPPAI